MSMFGSLMGDFDDDIFGNHMNAMNMQMRSMNRLMNTFMPDPFNMLTNFDGGFQQNALMERQNPHPMGGLFGFPAMPNMNRLLSADIGNPGGAAFCSSSVITMSSGPDGRPQIYQATSSTKTGPGGIRETRRTVQDSVNGVKKMAIGHHIGDRAHIIEKEQDLRSGQLEEHQEFINLEEDDAEDFDREFTTKAGGPSGRGGARAICAAPVPQQALTIEEIDDDDDDVIETVPQVQRPSSSSSQHRRHMPAIPAPSQPPSSSTQIHQNSVHPHPYNTSAARRSHHHHHHHHHHQHRPKQHATKQYTAPTSANSNNQIPSQAREEDSNSK
ncbi:myeloid leukemia factor isoform X2 [Calliphora vicina]|uniref:myeloid leukemia factor isoform X2 n=1 Tax=Calliphora vicina TaxID=7373 RepID=UPI00325B00BE